MNPKADGPTIILSPDELVVWDLGFGQLTATVVFTWLVMAVMVLGSWLLTRRLTSDIDMSRGQNLLEIVVLGMRDQIRGIAQAHADRYLPFVGTLFLFIAVSNILSVLPGVQLRDIGKTPGLHNLAAYQPPTGSLSTTAALAICVFFAVPIYGIAAKGLRGYLRQYIEPAILMLPFNIIGEVSRTLALAVRLFGNVMSSSILVGILLLLVPLFFPVVMYALGLLTGLVQAYIFAVLAMVYIASATRVHEARETAGGQVTEGDD